MILIVGAVGSGKRAFVCRELGFEPDDIAEAALNGKPVVAGVERLVCEVICGSSGKPLDSLTVPAAVLGLAGELSSKRVVICDEVGSGIVPLDAGERAWREAVGRLCCELASRADAVVRMVCGIPQVIKGEMERGGARMLMADGAEGECASGASATGCADGAFVHQASHDAAELASASGRSTLRVTLIRHGATAGNAAHRYIGARTDESLSPDGCAELVLAAYAAQGSAGVFGVGDAVGAAGAAGTATSACSGDLLPKRVYTSGMLRCDQTAAILFPQAERIAESDLREMDFGVFENRNAADMADDPAYRAWVDGGCKACCPGGEDRDGFVSRCTAAFKRLAARAMAAGDRHLVLVAHGGTIMALLSALCEDHPDYFSVRTAPGGWHELLWDGSCLRPVGGAVLAQDDSSHPATFTHPDSHSEGGSLSC